MLAMNTTQWRQRILLYSDNELCPKDADRIQHIAQVAVMSIFTMQCLPGRNSAVNSVTNVGYMSFHTRTILSLSQSVKSHHCHCQSPFELHLPSAETDPQRHTVKWTGSSAASCSRTLWQHTQLLIDVLSVAAIKSVTFLYRPVSVLKLAHSGMVNDCEECLAGVSLHQLFENDLQTFYFLSGACCLVGWKLRNYFGR